MSGRSRWRYFFPRYSEVLALLKAGNHVTGWRRRAYFFVALFSVIACLGSTLAIAVPIAKTLAPMLTPVMRDAGLIEWTRIFLGHHQNTDQYVVCKLIGLVLFFTGFFLLRPIIVVPCRIAGRLILPKAEPPSSADIDAAGEKPWTNAILAAGHSAEEKHHG